MPSYMVQSMSAGTLKKTTYYRKQTQPHPSHQESGAFTEAAKTAYANSNGIPATEVVPGTYMSGQGVPKIGVLI